MKIQIGKWLIVIATFVSLMLIVTGLEAGKGGVKPDKPGKPRDPVVDLDHVLAINGYGRHTDLYTVYVDGSNPVQIVRRLSGFPMPAGATVWSPDGKHIVFSELFDKNLQMVDVDGSNRKEILAPTEEMWPYIGGQRNLASSGFDCDGNQANLLYFLGFMKDDPFYPSYEESYEDFYVLDLDDLSPPPRRLTNNEFKRHTTLDVSPDGQFIATWTYAAGLNWDDPGARLEIRDACEDGLPVISSWTAVDLGQVPGYQFFARIDWSVEWVLAVSGHSLLPGTPEDIYLIDLDGSVTAEKLIGTGMAFGEGAANRRATWSPDGTQLAFTSGRNVYILENIVDKDSGVITEIAWFKLNRDIDWRPDLVENP